MLAGFLMSVALTRMIASLLYRVQPLDVLTFVAVGFVMSSFAVLAAFAPVNRAIRTDPNTVLRYE
jgi:ABC-type lipoprotein release transport system permease subunit